MNCNEDFEAIAMRAIRMSSASLNSPPETGTLSSNLKERGAIMLGGGTQDEHQKLPIIHFVRNTRRSPHKASVLADNAENC